MYVHGMNSILQGEGCVHSEKFSSFPYTTNRAKTVPKALSVTHDSCLGDQGYV